MKPVEMIRQRVRERRDAVRKREQISQFWDEQNLESTLYWTAHPIVREHVNRLITEVPWLWPLTALKVSWAYRTVPRGISIGCGTGSLERHARMLGICERIDAFDVSKESIREAKRLAKEEKIRGIRYRTADCDAITLPGRKYDLAFFHGSLHHISDPHRMLGEVRKSLKPHGLLFLDDYIGPSRDEWTDDHLVHARAEWEKLPESLRLQPVNPPLDWEDPSEMIASSSIRPAVEEHFEILQEKPYWGNLLFPVFCAVKGSEIVLPDNDDTVRRLVEREMELVEQGAFDEPLFTVMVARRKP